MKFLKVFLTAVFALGIVASVQGKNLYKDDFSDWRDESTNPGFKAKFELDEKNEIGIITAIPEKKIGKVMSSEAGITINIEENTELSLKLLDDISQGSITVKLMTAGDPYDSHKLIAEASDKGVYTAKLAEKTPWPGQEEHTFWIEIWIGGEENPVAKISDVCITDGKKIVAKEKGRKSKIKKKSRIKKKSDKVKSKVKVKSAEKVKK